MGKINIVLVEPEIPQNTGNIARTCAATGASLHLVEPLGFTITDAKLKRAGLDYWHYLDIHYHKSIEDFFEATRGGSYYYFTTKAPRDYCKVDYPDGCYLIFGKETKGLPEELLKEHPDKCLRVPMISDARSLNLSNTVALVGYEVLRQWNFEGLLCEGELHNLKW